MLPAASRLRRSTEFRAVLRQARPVRAGDLLTIRLYRAGPALDPQPTDQAPRVGFTVGRRVGPAVVRNRVRRRLRHLVRARLGRLGDGSRLVVTARPACARATSAELGRALDAALNKALARSPLPPGAAR